jgi:cytoskeleton protein RodZ
METLGVWLRQTREARDETLRDVEVATRIRIRFLRMLEEGEFDVFPGGEVQVRGFLRLYARHLDLSPDEVLSRYDKEVRRVEPAPMVAPVATQPVQPPAPPPRPVAGPALSQPGRPAAPSPASQWLSLETLIIACIVLIVLLVVLIVAMYVASRSSGGEAATVAPPTASAAAMVFSTQTALAIPTVPTVTPTFPVDPEGYVMLTLEATEHVWARVTVDGMVVFEDMLGPEQPKTWSGKREVVVETGNGAGLQVTVNGQWQGAMCGRAETCARGWGPTGEIDVP